MLNNVNTRRLIGVFVFSAIAFGVDQLSSISNEGIVVVSCLLVEIFCILIALGLLLLVVIEDNNKTL